MQKKFTRTKLTLIMTAILTAVLTFSIAIFGFVGLSGNLKQTERKTYSADSGNVSYGGYNFAFSSHWAIGLTYKYDEEDCLYIRPDYYTEIYNEMGLLLFAYLVNAGEEPNTGFELKYADAYLRQDMDMSNKTIPAIGNLTNPFMGSFNGNGYSIKNLTPGMSYGDTGSDIKEGSALFGTKYDVYNVYYGLFGMIDGATIQKVLLQYDDNVDARVDLVGDLNVGKTVYRGKIIAGYLVGCAKGNSSISKCYVDGNGLIFNDLSSSRCSTLSAYVGVGGLVGYIESGTVTIDTCGVNSNIETHHKHERNMGYSSGGLVGVACEESVTTIKNSYFYGNFLNEVQSPTKINVGGIVGATILSLGFGGLSQTNKITITGCFAEIHEVYMDHVSDESPNRTDFYSYLGAGKEVYFNVRTIGNFDDRYVAITGTYSHFQDGFKYIKLHKGKYNNTYGFIYDDGQVETVGFSDNEIELKYNREEYREDGSYVGGIDDYKQAIGRLTIKDNSWGTKPSLKPQ